MKTAVIWLAAGEVAGCVFIFLFLWWASVVTGLRARWTAWRRRVRHEREQERIMEYFRDHLQGRLRENDRRFRAADRRHNGRHTPPR